MVTTLRGYLAADFIKFPKQIQSERRPDRGWLILGLLTGRWHINHLVDMPSLHPASYWESAKVSNSAAASAAAVRTWFQAVQLVT